MLSPSTGVSAAGVSQHVRAKTLDLYDRLGRFTDLIFCPLDLPEPPKVTREALVDWVSSARAQRLTNEEQLFTGARDVGTYPWNSAYAAYHGEWRHGFEALFPGV